jgi:hypothetical protein
MPKITFAALALTFAFVANDAAAEGFINPFVGTTLTSPSPSGSKSKAGYGFALGGVGKVVGGETEFAYYPEVLDNTANNLAKNKVFTLSASTLVGVLAGPVKVYGALGFGDLHLYGSSLSSAIIPHPEDISTNYFTYNVGGGVMGFFSSHFGVRGDLRYYRSFGFKESDVQGAGLALDKFDFWRGDIGLAVRF